MSESDLGLAESVSTTNASYFIAVYLIILIYCCFALALVCDVYFVPALQKLSQIYDLPPDIAGSTLMALGASVPELFASLIGVFITHDDIGTGSVLGSSSFNLIAVPAACSFVAAASFGSKALSVSPMPVTRNSAFYAIIILVLLLIIKDNQVDIIESLILLLFFVMYMAFMVFCAKSNRKNQISVSRKQGSCNSSTSESQLSGEGEEMSSTVDSAINTDQDILSSSEHGSSKEAIMDMGQGKKKREFRSYGTKSLNLDCYVINHDRTFGKSSQTVINFVDLDKSMSADKCIVGETTALFDKQPSTFWTLWTFLISIALIGALTYVSVWLVHSMGKTLGIPETVAGITILSWGTGIPELIASIVLIRKTAEANMAICNTIGSNVIDISFCLSLPWIVKCLINYSCGLEPVVEIQSTALPWTGGLLLISVLCLLIILKCHDWKLGYGVGIWLLIVYILFVLGSIGLEYSWMA